MWDEGALVGTIDGLESRALPMIVDVSEEVSDEDELEVWGRWRFLIFLGFGKID